jgi:ABC-2 type transport system permease protein
MFGSLSKFAGLLVWEWRLVRAERSYWVTLALLGVLTASACAAGLSWTREHRAVVEEFRAQEAEDLAFMRSAFSSESDPDRIAGRPLDRERRARATTLRVIARLPTSVAYFGATWSALFPPSPLSSLSIGQGDLWPCRYPITARSKRTNLEREEIVNPFHLATGPFDPATVVVALLPLVLIALTYDLISADRERGVLALTLSQPLPYRLVVLAKLLIRAAVPAALVVVTGLGLLAGEAGRLGPGAVASFVLWSSLVLLYAALWAGLALAANTAGGSSVANAILLTSCWIGTVVLVPSGLGKAAALLHPVPPRSDLITLERSVRAQAEKDGRTLVEQFYREHPELARPDKKADPYGQTRWDAIAREVDRKLQPAIDRYREQVDGQLRFSGRWQTLSPALAVKMAIDDLAGTGLAHQLEFTTMADRYHSEFMDFLYPKMMTRYELTLDDYDRMPRYEGLDLGKRIHPSRIGRSLLTLSAWTAVLFLVGLVRLRRPIAAP